MPRPYCHDAALKEWCTDEIQAFALIADALEPFDDEAARRILDALWERLVDDDAE